MRSPQKPYENSFSNSSNTALSESNTNQSITKSNGANVPLPVPKRDSSISLTYNNSLSNRGNFRSGGAYGNYSNYGNSGNSGNYGNYGGRSNYGRNFGGSLYGNRNFGNRNYDNNIVEESEGGITEGIFHSINKIQYTTDVLAQFTGLVMMNAEAIYTSYSSFIGLLEGLSHLGYILSGFTVFSVLRNIIYWIIGKKKDSNGNKSMINQNNSFVNEFANVKKSSQKQWTSVIIIIGVLFIGFPLLTYLYKKMQELVDDEEPNHVQWKPQVAIAISDYRATGPDDIEFAKGDQILVISKPFAEWWEGEVYSRGQGQRGLFPYNFVEFVQPQIRNEETQLTVSKEKT